jgi:probable H4MPT-linked C1 transfer pathway protein
MRFLGIDVGGANLKAADGLGYAEAASFALWKHSQRLAHELRTRIAHAPASDHLVVTMTGELADCFSTKAEGVVRILDAVEEAADGRHTRVYLSDGVMVTPQVAKSRPLQAAAANWHALARFATRYARRELALLIDVGSTTCDIIPLDHGKPAARGTTDTERLVSGELLYTGIERSPVCAVAEEVPFRGQTCPLVHELFATMRDAYMILGQLPEDNLDDLTADGRPADKPNARARLARMIGADSESFNHRDAVALAQALAEAQARRLAATIKRVIANLPASPTAFVLSGHGEFLAVRAIELMAESRRIVSLSHELGPRVSRCAPAHALAVLAREAAGL